MMIGFPFKHVASYRGHNRDDTNTSNPHTIVYYENIENMTTMQFIQNVSQKILVDFSHIYSNRWEFDIVASHSFSGLDEYSSPPFDESTVHMTTFLRSDATSIAFYIRDRRESSSSSSSSSSAPCRDECYICLTEMNLQSFFECATIHHWLCRGCFQSCIDLVPDVTCGICRAVLRASLRRRSQYTPLLTFP